MNRIALAFAFTASLMSFAQAQQHVPQQLVGGEYLSSPITLSNGQRVMLQFDVNGNLKVAASFSPSGTQDVNVKNWAGVALGAPSAYGTSPGAVTVPGVNAFITNVPAVSQSGTWTVQPGNTANTTPWLFTISQGGNSATVSAGGALKVDASASTQPISGTVTANQGGTWNIATVTAVTAITNALPAGTNAIGTVLLPTTGTLAAGNGVVPVPSAESGAGLSTAASSALAANTVIKSGAGNLYSFNVSADSTLSGAAWWIMIYNATTAPVDGAVTPAKCYAMALGTTSFSAAFLVPVAFSTGIVIGVSTTGCFTKTASTHAFISGDYK